MAPPPAPNNNTDSGCFSAMLRHLLCRNGMPTHPSVELDHAPPPHFNKTLAVADRSCKPSSPPSVEKPGIVARLMGLETLPDFTRPRMKSTPGTVPRSRSVNFVDYLITGVHAPHHRRVRTSVSFREVVVPQDDLLVLYLGEQTMADQSYKLERNNSKGSRKEVNQKKDDKRSGVLVSKLRKETSPVRGHKQCSSIKVTDGKQRAAGRRIQQKEMVAESNFITKKRKQKRSQHRKQVVPEHSRRVKIKEAEDMNLRKSAISTPSETHYAECEDINYSKYGNNEDEAFELSSALEEICVRIEQRIITVVVEQMVGDLLRRPT